MVKRSRLRGELEARIKFGVIACTPFQTFPVEPKPPSPRSVPSSSAVQTKSACSTGTNISWAIRSPGVTVYGVSEVVSFEENAVVLRTSQGTLVIQGRDMTSEAAMTKLMWAIGQGMDSKSIEQFFRESLAGEITVTQ